MRWCPLCDGNLLFLWWCCFFFHGLLIHDCWCLFFLCCDAFVFCLLWCWCRAWQNEVWIVVWWTWCSWRTIGDVHHVSIVLPWFDLYSDGSCRIPLMMYLFQDRCLGRICSRAWDLVWWLVVACRECFLQIRICAYGSLVVWLPSSEVAGYSITVDEVVVDETRAVFDEPWHDWVLHAKNRTHSWFWCALWWHVLVQTAFDGVSRCCLGFVSCRLVSAWLRCLVLLMLLFAPVLWGMVRCPVSMMKATMLLTQ